MSSKKVREIRGLSAGELELRIREAQEKLFDAKMQLRMGRLSDKSQLWKLRKGLARMKTIRTEITRQQGGS